MHKTENTWFLQGAIITKDEIRSNFLVITRKIMLDCVKRK